MGPLVAILPNLQLVYDYYSKKDTLATKFNAGGNMSISMLSSTIVSQWTWAASLLQSTSVGTNVRNRVEINIKKIT